jgi:hypothetical protein
MEERTHRVLAGPSPALHTSDPSGARRDEHRWLILKRSGLTWCILLALASSNSG